MSSDYAAWRERLAAANDARFWPIKYIDKELDEGRAQFWCDGTSALVTRLVAYPGGAVVLEALAAAGKADDIIERFEPQCEAFARQSGALRMEAKGRLGWLKKHPPGWRAHQVVLIRDLNDGH